mmetsp:Transcript_8568/g.19854  ORF Transcript_8568/g.19854 Transcript_8568/m.19854 type:complete len:218 (-) Transcript_8568:334-987(-)
MQQNDGRSLVNFIRLTSQDFGIHDSQYVCIDLDSLFLSRHDLGGDSLVDTLPQMRFEILDLSLQEPLHDPREGVFDDVDPPIFQRKVRIQFPQFPNGHGVLRFGREGIIHTRDPVHPRILGCLPGLPSILGQVIDTLSHLLGTRLFIKLLTLFQNALYNGSFSQSFLHSFPCCEIFTFINDHNFKRTIIGCCRGGISFLGGHVMDFLIDILALVGLQ